MKVAIQKRRGNGRGVKNSNIVIDCGRRESQRGECAIGARNRNTPARVFVVPNR